MKPAISIHLFPSLHTSLRKAVSDCSAASGLALLVLAVLAGASDVNAQAVLNPNQLRGTIGFNNQNPEVLNILSSSGLGHGMNSAYVPADSLDVDPPLNNYTRATSSNGIDAPYGITVETSTEGIAYVMSPYVYLDKTTAYYRIAPMESPPVLPEPADDVTFDLLECAGIVDVNWVDVQGDPISVQGGFMRASKPDFAAQAWDWRIGPDVSQEYLVVHGDGSTYDVQVVYEFGDDLYSNTVRGVCTESITVACDEIVEMTCVLDGTTQLGEIAGELDMLGEDEHRIFTLSSMAAHAGPLQNQRRHTLARAPSQGAFTLPNLVPSDAEDPPRGYQMYGTMIFRTGHRAENFRTPMLYNNNRNWGTNHTVMVEAGQATQIGDTFVLDPGYVRGSIRLAGPSMNSGDSCLQDIYRDADSDSNGDGIPNNYWISSSYIQAHGLGYLAAGATATATGGHARVGFEGSFDPNTGEFNGDYELVLGGLHGESSIWRPDVLNLRLSDDNLEPESFQNSWFRIRDGKIANHEIVPGQSLVTNRAYCMSQVQLTYHTLSGSFSDPKARIAGNFAGTDFEGTESAYSTMGWAYGTPRGMAAAASDGAVNMCLPQGTYTLTPTVTAQNPSGGTSNTELPPVTISVGCGQDIVATTALQISLDELPQVSGGSTLALGGSVNSDGNVVELGYQHNDHFEVLLCDDCGEDPEFSAEIELEPGENVIRVWARDEFDNEASVEAVITHVLAPVLAGCDEIEVDLEPDQQTVDIEFGVHVSEGHSSTVLSCDPASGSEFGPGEHLVACVAEDELGGSDECQFEIFVNEFVSSEEEREEEEEVPEDPQLGGCENDITAPIVECSVTKDRLWPPNHGFVDVGLEVIAGDECDNGESTALADSLFVSVWSDETELPEAGDGSGHTAPDAGFLDATLALRAERRGTEDGRVYLAIAEAEDASGNVGFACCTVVVPHDRSESSDVSIWDQADAARAYCDEFGAPPPSYTEHGISREIGRKRLPTSETDLNGPGKGKGRAKGKGKGRSGRKHGRRGR